ncbi:ATP-dependent helicase C-terminal domain-containing protein [Actinacidiphila oryziradicis]|uniref:ATP-dependent RNA helicase n=1 Tax=Actinacidiphila oryziradicis TaxID=2571141 RepID=UPI0023F47737|nr:ATP-dependent helicase C-terminal domain-containing protein [Actinacidiphila oryziradicis]MCW2871365.1 ATP-dependent helicase HrpB [Actinacidiphila oryziradicis]
MIRTEALDLPVRTAVPALLRALEEHGCAVLAAPPGTGKTTLVPLVLAGVADGGAARRVIVAEPRRMAARAAARRMAWLLGEETGGRVGFTVRGERKVSAETVVEVVTTGVLLQRLQRDQELAGVDAVVLDECHERHLDADTVLAFLLDVRAALRPDLRLVAASATTDADAWSRLLGGAPVVTAEGRMHPVALSYAPPPRTVRPPHGMRVDPALLDHVAATARSALARAPEGDVLCFLPGAGEIGRVAGLLGGVDAEVLQLHGQAPASVQEAVLRGGDGTRRRIILSTSVAESSLTVPGVRIVVDSGLAREPRTDHARGLGSLTTVRASLATSDQRTGRAGREAPGAAYRCWAEAENAARPRWPAPEIAVADLTAFALQAACWGDPDASGLALLDAPPGGAMAAAREVLAAIGAVDGGTGRVTGRGVRLARMGVHPRLARALLDGATAVGARRAAEVVALLSEEPPRSYGDDLAAAWRTARRGGDGYAARWRAEARRLASAAAPSARDASQPATHSPGTGSPTADAQVPGSPSDGHAPAWRPGDRHGQPPTQDPATGSPTADAQDAGSPSDGHARTGQGSPPGPRDAVGRSARSRQPAAATAETVNAREAKRAGPLGAADARPNGHSAQPGTAPGGASDDAVAGLVAALAFPERVARRRGGGAYLMASGTAAQLADGSRLDAAEWLAVAVADRPAGAPSARVRLAAVIDGETARTAAGPMLASYEEVGWDGGDVVARSVERLGAIELASRPLRSPGPELLRAALAEGLRREGPELLRWTRDAQVLRQRLAFLHRELGAPWPDVSDAALLDHTDEWLGPELARARRRADLERVDAGQALSRLLPWATGDAARLGELAPERIEVPSGSRIRVSYEGEQPVLAAKLQELFGWQRTPRLAGGRVPLLVHLLSPAGRPAAVTADLASFWREGYRSVRAELRGRYPKHPWPEDPSAAEPTRRTKPRPERG